MTKLSDAEIQQVISMAEQIPPTLQTEVHFSFTAAFMIELLNEVIAHRVQEVSLAAEVTDLQEELIAIKAPPPVEEEIIP